MLYDDSKGLVAAHPDPAAIRVFVASAEKYAPEIRETFALPVGNGLYKLLPTPHYTEKQQWKFPPGSIVRIEPMRTAMENWKPWIAVERVG
jgi:hypothetical protein